MEQGPMSNASGIQPSRKEQVSGSSAPSGRFTTLSCGLLAVGSELWAASCGQRAVGSELWDASCGQRAVGSELWAASCGLRAVGC
ncbi:hypothetical protein F7725_025847 [Dissostichus mawsoni]|uniref:Uncharacterized protein n=1 Tax=Dissostichus mawsoni TaxID=36200 RepID=A0A7J5X5F4_DISMA|nr:hypothetical protein F7725_025847 [Dissostichus mawsoni]